MKEINHPYWEWEDWRHGMWSKVSGDTKKMFLEKAIAFTGNAYLYGEAMMRVIKEWPISCEHNLTKKSINRLAYIGHAACCLSQGCPESITREAWGYLTQEQQDEANLKAKEALLEWERSYAENNRQICFELEAARV